MEKFKYDIFTLIEAVESKDCLWDKTSEEYKDKIKRKNGWRWVSKVLEPEFENLEMKSQEEIISIIMNKWTHIRDSFIRSLKTKSGQGTKRKYVYAEYLQFLLKNRIPDDTESSIQSAPSTREDPIQSDDGHDLDEASALNTGPRTTPMNKHKKINNIDIEILNAIRSSSPTRKEQPIDEDHAFLLSLLPTLKKIPEDDKMDFRIEVMHLVNKYKKRNSNFSSSRSYTTQVSTSPPQETPRSSYMYTMDNETQIRHDLLPLRQSDETPSYSYYTNDNNETETAVSTLQDLLSQMLS